MADRQFNGAILDIRTLPAEPNQERSFHLDLVAPQDLGTVVMEVVPGSVVSVDITLRSLVEGVLFEGRADSQVRSECVRCLEPIEGVETTEVSQMFFTPEAIAHMREEHGEEGVEDLEVLEGDEIALEPIFRDAIVTSFPFQPLCRADCKGLCDVCGKKWEDLPSDHMHEVIDPRFAKLAALLEQDQK